MEHQTKGSMTVFFSILTVLFLSLLCALAESARIQGARVKASSVLDLGVFSLFGEYDKYLLEEYDVFAFNGSYGTGTFSIGDVEERLDRYMSKNAKPGTTLFPMDTEGSQILEYALLTDSKGEVFKNQVVSNLKSAIGTEAAARFLEKKRDAEAMEKEGELYEQQEQTNHTDLERLEAEKEQAAAEETKEAGVVEITPEPETPTPANPLDVIKQIKKTGILGLVMRNPEEVSKKTLEKDQLVSRRRRENGNMRLPGKQSGVAADAVFLEYLTSRFGNFREPKEKSGLAYQMEYLLGGKTSDRENLKKVVNKLLFVREGVNFLCIGGNARMRHEAELLAAALTAAIPIPGITAATTAALLLAWAYGESLLDVRQLLAGGKVPLVKTEQSIKLTLNNLIHLTEVLKECDSGGGEGVDYEGYLQILLVGGSQKEYPMRALDLIETELRQKENYGSFCIDHCIAGLSAQAEWQFKPVFSGAASAFLGGRLGRISYVSEKEFCYQTG